MQTEVVQYILSNRGVSIITLPVHDSMPMILIKYSVVIYS